MSHSASYRRVAAFKSLAAFQDHLDEVHLSIPLHAAPQPAESDPLSAPFDFERRRLPNRFAILPMEGWDGTPDGFPSQLTRRRWQRFGESGAGLIWGGEAVAVQPAGRANPNQLMINPHTVDALAGLRQNLLDAHRQTNAGSPPMTGLQLTHSGRYCRPDPGKQLQPVIAYHHPLLDPRVGVPSDHPLISDEQLEDLIEDYARAAALAQQAGFDFVDLKHCHGYLLHELLSAVNRPGKFGGSFENRTRFLRLLVSAVRQAAPGLQLGVRLSAFDLRPFHPGPDGIGQPEAWSGDYPYAFGSDNTGLGIDLREPLQLVDILHKIGVRLLCVTAGSPYYNPHIQRPALFPPSDGYLPPEDPLIGVARQIEVTAAIKQAFPEMVVVGSAYSYLQEYLPAVARGVLVNGMADFIGYGRLALSYPQIAADTLHGADLQRKQLCRTFSDCTTAPRIGLVSGCYPLDDSYRSLPEYQTLQAFKNK